MRELVASATLQKPAIPLLDLDTNSKGGMSLSEVRTQLLQVDDLFRMCGLQHNLSEIGLKSTDSDEMSWRRKAGNGRNDASQQASGHCGGIGEALSEYLFAHEPIEWNRIGHFQDVTMRLIAERMLPNAAGSTYVKREVVNQKLGQLRRPKSNYHLYCSALNPGALELMKEVGCQLHFEVHLEKRVPSKAKTTNTLLLTSDVSELVECDHMLLYLNGMTWTRGDASAALSDEVLKAMNLGIHIMLVHEMPGGGGESVRYGCEFAEFFINPDGTTPIHLMKRGIYSEVALPLKGGAYRETSMVLVGMQLGMGNSSVEQQSMTQGSSKDIVAACSAYTQGLARCANITKAKPVRDSLRIQGAGVRLSTRMPSKVKSFGRFSFNRPSKPPAYGDAVTATSTTSAVEQSPIDSI